eukprot:COSAG06_NODE_16159_length_1018_cov_0.763874_1_plen_57_part_10
MSWVTCELQPYCRLSEFKVYGGVAKAAGEKEDESEESHSESQDEDEDESEESESDEE